MHIFQRQASSSRTSLCLNERKLGGNFYDWRQIYEVYRYEFFQEIRDKISLSPVKIPNEEFYRFDKQDRINYAIADFQ